MQILKKLALELTLFQLLSLAALNSQSIRIKQVNESGTSRIVSGPGKDVVSFIHDCLL